MASGLRHTLVSWAQPTRGINITAGAQLRRTQSSPVQCNAASVRSGQECNESFPNVLRRSQHIINLPGEDGLPGGFKNSFS